MYLLNRQHRASLVLLNSSFCAGLSSLKMLAALLAANALTIFDAQCGSAGTMGPWTITPLLRMALGVGSQISVPDCSHDDGLRYVPTFEYMAACRNTVAACRPTSV